MTYGNGHPSSHAASPYSRQSTKATSATSARKRAMRRSIGDHIARRAGEGVGR